MNTIRRNAILLLSLLAMGCPSNADKPIVLTVATTTSTRDSGLLDALLPRFEEQTGIEVRVVAVGTGQALEIGRRGDADVLLTHAPDAERQFVAEGYGTQRLPIMHNGFVLVGPNDTAIPIEQRKSVTGVFRTIAKSELTFVSRGDDSGTHMREMEIWNNARIAPAGEWYVEAGTGMAQTLRMADQKRALTLSDLGTFLAQRDGLELTVIVNGHPLLHNQYSVLLLSQKKHPHLQHEAAQRFAEFLRSEETQRLIAQFGVEKYGEPLFFPNETGQSSAPK